MAGYYVGGRDLGGFAVGVSFFATYASTNSYIGNAGKGYEYGVPWLLLGVFMVLFTLLSWLVVAPRMRRFAAHWDALTIPAYLERRFPARGNALRITAAIVIVFSSVLYLMAVFKGSGHLFEQFLDMPYEAAVGMTLAIVMLYTSVGGFVSVVRTDVVQGALMVLGSITMFAFVTDAAGGIEVIGDLRERPDTSHLFEASGAIPFIVLLGITLSGTLKLLVDPRQVSRFYALRDERSVRVGLFVAVGGIAIVMLLLLPVGLYAHFLVDGITDTDLVVPTLVADPNVFPTWAADFLVIAMLAAAMSSMDSVLLVAASVLYHDLVGVARPSARPLAWTRAGVIGFAMVAAVFALRPPAGIVEITVFSGSLYAVCFFPAILFGLHWRGGSAQAVLASVAVGVPVLVLWILSGLGERVHELFPALAASCITYLVVARFTRPGLRFWPGERVPEGAA
jgi:SSS family transporter